MYIYLIFFFFQAEDGIRDGTVTGVQTCALPILNSSYFAVPGRGGASAGKPPAHDGISSPNPAARFSLMVPQAPRSQARSATARTIAKWRVRIGICGLREWRATLLSKSGGLAYPKVQSIMIPNLSAVGDKLAISRSRQSRPSSRLTSSLA